MMFGYACNETDVLMPMPIHLAHRLPSGWPRCARAGQVPYLRPDGKTQVTVEYEDNRPVRIARVLVSTQHQPDIDTETLLRPTSSRTSSPRSSPTGLEWDPTTCSSTRAGSSSSAARRPTRADRPQDHRRHLRRHGPHGGGAFSGKDSTKVDRSAAYAARWVAKNIVAAGLADRAELQVAYAIGVAHPVSMSAGDLRHREGRPGQDPHAVREVFDLRPAAIIRDLELRRPVFAETAAYGHFGREGDDVHLGAHRPADALRDAAGA
jgi:S-adenosylmethionine synthetase